MTCATCAHCAPGPRRNKRPTYTCATHPRRAVGPLMAACENHAEREDGSIVGERVRPSMSDISKAVVAKDLEQLRRHNNGVRHMDPDVKARLKAAKMPVGKS